MEYRETPGVALAAGVTFYGLLAIFPALAALVSLYGLFADPATIASHLQTLAGVLPSGGIEVIGNEIKPDRGPAKQHAGPDIPDRIGGVGVERECRNQSAHGRAQSCFSKRKRSVASSA